MLGYNDSRGCVLTWYRMTPGVSLSPRIEQLHGRHSVLGMNNSRRIILSRDRTTPMRVIES